MMNNFDYWLGDTMVLVLIAVAVMGISTALAMFRKLKMKDNKPEALIFFTLSSFFWALHLIWINFAPPESILFNMSVGFWHWLVFLFSPALIIVFLIHAAYWYAKTGGWPALVRVFCGVTLACILYMLGESWSTSLKGTVAMLWTFFLWRIEFPSNRRKRPAFIYVTRRLL